MTPLATQLSWSHFIELFPLKTNEARMYYAQKVIEEAWGKRDLKAQIDRKAFERQEIANVQFSANRPELMNTFKDPYVLDFLNLKNKMKLILVYLLGSITESKVLEKEMESNLKSLRYE